MGEPALLGLALGTVIGLLYARVGQLRRRLDELGAAIADSRRETSAAELAPAEAEPGRPAGSWPPSEGEGLPSAASAPATDTSYTTARATEAWSSSGAISPGVPSLTDFFSALHERARHWLTTGNVPVKVGVIVSLIGVSFLLKYAIERQLLAVPIELRLLAVALAAIVLVFIGWRLRERLRVYGLSLQGGGVGMLYLTIFAAMRIWQLLPPGLAFVLLVLLTIAIATLAVLQNAPTLAVFGVVGGFLAPVLTSTGQGSHVVLFGYYLVINVGILAIAWFRAWRFLNLIGFTFTFLIAGLWGWRYFSSELFTSTEPFLVLYFLFYQAIAVLYALRQPPQKLGLVDGTLVFGTPVIAFALQYELVRNFEYGLAISAAVLALFYAVTASLLYRRRGEYLRLLSESFIALGVAFATLAIPLALDARWTSAAWALEGAALVWIGVRQQRHLANLAGIALLFLGGAAFALHGWRSDAGIPVINGNVLGGLLVSLGSLFAAQRLGAFADAQPAPAAPYLGRVYRLLCRVMFAWATLWWLGTAWAEIVDRASLASQLAYFTLFVAASALAASRLAERRDLLEMRYLALGYLPLLAVLALLEIENTQHALHGPGWLAWPAALAVQGWILRDADRRGSTLAPIWHLLSLLLLVTVLASESWWRVSRIASPAWAQAAVLAVIGIFVLAIWRLRDSPPWPVAAHRSAYLRASLNGLLLLLAVLCLLSLSAAGDPAPFDYLPLLNPYDLATLFAALLTWVGLKMMEAGEFPMLDPPSDAARWARRLVALAFVILTSAALVRGIHFQTGVAWRPSALFDSVRVQTALSIYWGMLGFVGMLMGARRASRPLWLAGAGSMGLVVVKLFLVDLGNSGTVERIVSFIGIGALLLVVGYFAPVPPRLAEPREERRHDS